MKLLLLTHSDPSVLVIRLQDQGHAVMAILTQLEDLFDEVFRHRPHAIIVCGQSTEAFVRQAGKFASSLPDQRVVLHQPIDSVEILDQQLAEIRRQVAAHKQAPIADTRLIRFDPAYNGLHEGGKLRSIEPTKETLSIEQDKLLMLLEQATVHHNAARRYHEELETWSFDEIREISYRTMHGSFKATAFAQEQVGRWLAVLAHYVPGIVPCYFPTPGDAICGVRWVFHGTSPETAYALACLSTFGFIEQARAPLEFLLTQKFAGSEESLSVPASITLIGCCAVLAQATNAHLSLMERYMNQHSCDELLRFVIERKGRREHQTFCEFWDLPVLREYPQFLAQTVTDFHQGRCASVKPIVPTFRDILAAR